MDISLIFLIIAIILCALAAFNVSSPRVGLGWAGVAFFAASFLPLG
jgi:hypothetical protein